MCFHPPEQTEQAVTVVALDSGKGQIAQPDEQGYEKKEGQPIQRALTQQAEKQGEKPLLFAQGVSSNI